MTKPLKLSDWLPALCLGFALGWLLPPLPLGYVTGQERDPSYHQTLQWDIPIPDRAFGGRVHVIDTAGVCLYVTMNNSTFDTAITAVPKTALGPGRGCE